jgi:hypothetical protein
MDKPCYLNLARALTINNIPHSQTSLLYIRELFHECSSKLSVEREEIRKQAGEEVIDRILQFNQNERDAAIARQTVFHYKDRHLVKLREQTTFYDWWM